MAECSYCGTETSMPYKCKFCGELFCSNHRLPENHNCQGLEGWKKKRKEEKKEEIMYEPFIKGENIETESPSPIQETFSSLGNILPQKATYLILGSLLVAFIIQLAIGLNQSAQILGLKPNLFFSQPWRLFTSMFVHGGLWHLFANGMTLYFLGSNLENLIGKKYFLVTYFAGGVAGGLFYALAPIIGLGDPSIAAVGASGAIFAVGAALAILRPKLEVFIFPLFIPIPLYIAIFGVFFVLSFLPGVAWQGHMGGLIVGVLMGYWLKKNNKARPTMQDFMRNALQGFQIDFNDFSNNKRRKKR